MMMRVTRMALRVVGALLVAMIAVWFALRSVETSTEESLSYSLQTNLESAIHFFVVCFAALVLIELGRLIASRLRR